MVASCSDGGTSSTSSQNTDSPASTGEAGGSTVVAPPTTDPATTSTGSVPPTETPGPASVRVLFAVNVQDFAHPDESAAILDRLVSLHEDTGVAVDIYLTDDMARILSTKHPEVFSRLVASPVVAISYHVRPPRPYGSGADWLGLGAMTPDEQYSTVLRYETHAVDPVTGETTDGPGGYRYVADLIGYLPPAAAAAPSDSGVASAVRAVYADLGASLTVVHGRPAELGDVVGGLLVRPEQAEARLWEHPGEDPADILAPALETALGRGTAGLPFIGVKIHDNDFFATASAWTTVYVQDRRRPPWDPTLAAPLLTTEERDAMWTTYEDTVRLVAEREDLESLNLRDLLEAMG